MERVTFFNDESGLAVLRVKVPGQLDLVTVLGSLPARSVGAARLPLSCTPTVVMQKTPQGANWTENADSAAEAEVDQPAYFL
ncbi:MAG: hypothetical protein RB191_18550 [Terriglobia bacterium]|nr:hypothetical protein [Terriglobia bacterium]